MAWSRIFLSAALIACAGFLFALPAAEASPKKKTSGGTSYSSGSSHSSGHRSSRSNLAVGLGAAAIGYGLTGGIQQAIQNAPADRRDPMEAGYDREDMRDNIRARTPEELKKLRAAAKGRKNQQQEQQEAEAARETMNLFLGIGGLGR